MPTKKRVKQKTPSLQEVAKTQQQILSTQKKILSSLQKQEDEEIKLTDIKELEQFEEHLKHDIAGSPLRRITYRDVTKGMVGAFIGVVGHFAFAETSKIIENHSLLRSTILLIFAFALAVAFIYFTGFRKVNDRFVFRFLPIRALVIYLSSLTTIVISLLLYGTIDYSMSLSQVYQIVAGISVIAVLGAGTADLIGPND